MATSPYINRFIQPDSIIPDLSNPQSWNRYSYVYNRPIKLNDPSGHCPWCIVVAIGVGTIAGAVGGAAGYLSANALSGNEFDRKSFAVATIGGSISGGLTIAAAIAEPVAAPATVPLVNGIVTAGQYIVDRKIHNDPVDWRKTADIENVAANFAVGALVSPIAGTFSSNFIRSGGRQFLIEFGEQTFTQSSRRFAQEFIEEQAIEVIKTGVRSYLSNAASNLVNKGLNWIIERTDRKNESWLEYK